MSEIKIDENSHEVIPTIWQRLRNAVAGVVMGIVLMQVILFNAFITWLDHPIFITYLAFCSIVGGWKGQKFIQAVNREIGLWKFW